MIVQGQLEDAQFQIAADLTALQALTAKVGQPVFVISEGKVYIYTGAAWAVMFSPSPEVGVGTIVPSMLTEAQFATENGSGWVPADGRIVTDSDYHVLTTNTTVPDLRGVFIRGKDGARGLDPDGDKALGTYTNDKMAQHTHNYTDETTPTYVVTGGQEFTNVEIGQGSELIRGSAIKTVTPPNEFVLPFNNENAPKSVTVNYFIKIDRNILL
jgi:hypothetical protein